MLALLATLIAAAHPPDPAPAVRLGRTAWIFATVGHSEFCPAGNLILDLKTGRYTLTPRASRRTCQQAGLERPVVRGRLAGARLAGVRTAYLRSLSEGLESELCREGGRPENITISNGGTPVLVATNGSGSGSAPDDLSCWSEAATALHDALDEAFDGQQGD